MPEDFEKPKKTPDDNEKKIEDTQEEFEEELVRLQQKFEADINAYVEKLHKMQNVYEAQKNALDSLSMLTNELHEDFISVVQKLSTKRFEVVDMLATKEEIEKQFKENPKVTIDLHEAGLTTLLDDQIDSPEMHEKIVMSAITQLNARAIIDRPKNIEFNKQIADIQSKLGDKLSQILETADFGSVDSITVGELEENLKQYAINAGKTLEESKRELNELFYNR